MSSVATTAVAPTAPSGSVSEPGTGSAPEPSVTPIPELAARAKAASRLMASASTAAKDAALAAAADLLVARTDSIHPLCFPLEQDVVLAWPDAVRSHLRSQTCLPNTEQPGLSGDPTVVYTGTKLADSTPSPSRFWSMLGMRMATAKASPAPVLPSSREATVSRPSPASRLAPIPGVGFAVCGHRERGRAAQVCAPCAAGQGEAPRGQVRGVGCVCGRSRRRVL